jgi:hypothetical protein
MNNEVRLPPAGGASLTGDESNALPVWIVVQAAAATLAAVVFVHLFAGPIEPLGAFAAHALLISGAYTAAFTLTYLALQRLQQMPSVRAIPTPVLAVVLSGVACLAGSAVLRLLMGAGGAVGALIDVHDDANWALKLLPLWLVLPPCSIGRSARVFSRSNSRAFRGSSRARDQRWRRVRRNA